jgi:hypothetical protein
MKLLNFIKNVGTSLRKEIPEAKSLGKSCAIQIAILGCMFGISWCIGWIANLFIPATIFPSGNPTTMLVGAIVIVTLFFLLCAVFAVINFYNTLKKIWDKS